MKNFLIYLSILTVVILAAIDAQERMKELDEIAGKTPAQVEIKDDILNQTRFNTRQKLNDNIEHLQNTDNIFNQKLKEQQSNNLPQEKQPNPLSIKK